MTNARTTIAIVLLLGTAACSGGTDEGNSSAEIAGMEPVEPVGTASADDASGDNTKSADAPKADADMLTLEGLGVLKIGAVPPPRSGWAERGAQVPGGCSTLSSPDYPGAYAIVEDGQVQRITLGKQSDVKLIEGIGVGSGEADVRAAFPGFREEPHKYVEAPAKYLTAPMDGSGPGLRFEIDRDGKVSAVHVGVMPQLSYVEGCA